MKIEYDNAADALYIRFLEEDISETREIEQGIIIDYGEEGEEVFHTWIMADSLVVMLIWVKRSGCPGLTLWARTSSIPESALEQLRSVLERATGMRCTR